MRSSSAALARAWDDIDRLVHEPARLRIVSQLYVVESADFVFVMRQTGLTQGNLSSHVSKLEVAGYVEIRKEFILKKPRTLLRLTEAGRCALDEYVAHMRKVLDDLSPTDERRRDGVQLVSGRRRESR